MNTFFKVSTILVLITLSMSAFAKKNSRLTIKGKIDTGLSVNAEVTYTAKNKYIPRCGRLTGDITTGPEIVGRTKTKKFAATLDEKGNYELKVYLRHDTHKICGWELSDFTLNVPIFPMPAEVTKTFATFRLESYEERARDVTFKDVTFIECDPKWDGGDIWNYCKTNFGRAYDNTSDLMNFDWEIQTNREVNIDIRLKKHIRNK